MKWRNVWCIVILIIIAILIMGVYYHKIHHGVVPTPQQLIVKQDYDIKTMRILPNSRFEFVLSNHDRICGCLRGSWAPEGDYEVIQLMNSAEKGKITVLCVVDGVYVVDVFLTIKKDGEKWTSEINLWDWLKQKKLNYQSEMNQEMNKEKNKEKLRTN